MGQKLRQDKVKRVFKFKLGSTMTHLYADGDNRPVMRDRGNSEAFG